MIRFLKFIRWLFSCGIVLWFVATLLLPLYGWLSPWPSASERLKEEGFTGLHLMIGASSSGKRVDDSWKKEKQRSFVVFPDSLRQMEILSYQESSGSEITGVKKEIIRSHWLIPIFALWIIAGVFSTRIALSWIKKPEANQAPQRNAGSRPSSGDSSASGTPSKPSP